MRYLKENLRRDAYAGLSVAVMSLAQGVAYALMAGVPPIYGVYSSIVITGLAAVLGSSSHLVIGPTNTCSLVVFSLTGALARQRGLDQTETVLLVTLMTGVLQVCFGLLRFGVLMRYVSNSVMVGFATGVAVLIAAEQLDDLIGIAVPEGAGQGFFPVVYHSLAHLPQANPYALGIGAITAVLLLAIPHVNRRLPSGLIAIAVAALVVWSTNWADPTHMGAWKVRTVQDVEPVKRGLQMFHVPRLLTHPDWSVVRQLWLGSVMLALLTLMEGGVIARSLAARSGQRVDYSRQFVAHGVANALGAFFSSFAGSGSYNRSAMAVLAGGRTRMTVVLSSVWLVLILLFFAPLANWIAIPSLAGMLIVLACTMIERHRFRLVWLAGRHSRLQLLGTLVATLVLPLTYAILVGVVLSIVLHLRATSRIEITQLVAGSGGGVREIPLARDSTSPILVVNLEGDLFFGAVDNLDHNLRRLLPPATRVIVLRMKRLRAAGSTAVAALFNLNRMLQENRIRLVVCGVDEEIQGLMAGTGLLEAIGANNVFPAESMLFESTGRAIERANEIIRNEFPGDLPKLVDYSI